MPRLAPWFACALLALVACKEKEPPPTPAPAHSSLGEAAAGAVPAPSTPTPASNTLEISDATGATQVRITPKDGGGYRLEDASGTKIGKISVESDRVKVKDSAGTLRAKVKKKDDGFKLYAGDDSVVLKGKLDGDSGLKLKTDDGTRLGKLDGAFGKVGDAKVEAKVVEGGVEVHRGGALVAKVKGNLPAEPAALLALEDLDVYQRAALLVFVREVF